MPRCDLCAQEVLKLQTTIIGFSLTFLTKVGKKLFFFWWVENFLLGSLQKI